MSLNLNDFVSPDWNLSDEVIPAFEALNAHYDGAGGKIHLRGYVRQDPRNKAFYIDSDSDRLMKIILDKLPEYTLPCLRERERNGRMDVYGKQRENAVVVEAIVMDASLDKAFFRWIYAQNLVLRGRIKAGQLEYNSNGIPDVYSTTAQNDELPQHVMTRL